MSIALQEAIAPPPAVEQETVVDPVYGPLYRVSVPMYLEMVERGILSTDDKVELVEGVLVAKMGKNPPHIFAGKRIFSRLTAVLPPGWHVSKEDPVRGPDSVPEPDCAVLRGEDSDYLTQIPGPGDTAMVVEISESSIDRDRGSKFRAYARANIPVYWLVNLLSGRIEVYSDPTGPADRPSYRVGWSFGREDEVPVVLDGREVGRLSVRELLP